MKALALTGFLLVFVLAGGFAFYSVVIDERGYGRGKWSNTVSLARTY